MDLFGLKNRSIWAQLGFCYLAISLLLCFMAPKANVAQVVPDGYVLIWNYFGAEPVPVLLPIPVPAPIALVPPVPAPIALLPPSPAAVSMILDYWWEHVFFGCGENHAHDNVNVQWRQFYRQHRT